MSICVFRIKAFGPKDRVGKGTHIAGRICAQSSLLLRGQAEAQVNAEFVEEPLQFKFAQHRGIDPT
jgi:hypothetical protein